MVEQLIEIVIPSGNDEAQFTESRFVLTNRTLSKTIDLPTLARLKTHTLIPSSTPDWQIQEEIVSPEEHSAT